MVPARWTRKSRATDAARLYLIGLICENPIFSPDLPDPTPWSRDHLGLALSVHLCDVAWCGAAARFVDRGLSQYLVGCRSCVRMSVGSSYAD